MEPPVLIRARAPLRLSFGGGGTDVPPYCDQRGGRVLNATINRYAYATLASKPTPGVEIRALDFGIVSNVTDDKPADDHSATALARAMMTRFPRAESLLITTHADAPPGSGLGSSSAMAVALAGAFREWQRAPLDEYEIAALALEVERVQVGLTGGKQDQYAATFGGFNFMEFDPGQVVVTPIRLKQDLIQELEYRILLVYTGVVRSSARIIEDQVGRYQANELDAVAAMDGLRGHAVEMKRALLTSRLNELGELLHESWLLKKRMSPHITTPSIDELYEAARRAGALGGKLSGAGGGGFMMLFCGPHARHQVADAVRGFGAKLADFQFEPQGLSAWRPDDNR